MSKALILVDIQRDFLPGGALPVPDGDQVVPVANQAMQSFDLVLATQDWHPADHLSFAGQHEGREPGDLIELSGIPQILWPDHCVQNTPGADFAPGLKTAAIAKTFYKGTRREVDSYSGFFDNGHVHATGLGDYLKEKGIQEITVLGLATDYCVLFTVIDGCRLGLSVTVIREGIRGVELTEGDCAKALQQMQEHGARIASRKEIL